MAEVNIAYRIKISKLIAPPAVLKTKKNRLAVLLHFANLSLSVANKYSANFPLLPFSGASKLAELQKHHSLSSDLIGDIFKQLKKQAMIGQFPFLAAITAKKTHVIDHNKYDSWRGLVLLCCLQLALLGKHDSAIKDALRQVRLISTKESHADLLTILPDISTFDSLNTLLRELDEIRTQLKNKAHQKHQYYSNFCFLHVAIRDAIHLAAGIIRTRKNTDPKELNISLETAEVFEGQFVEIKASREPKTSQEKDESLANPKTRTFRNQNSSGQSIAFQAWKSQQQLKHFKHRDLSLIADPHQLSEYDVKQFVIYCIENIENDAACWLLTSLILGRSFEYLSEKNSEETLFLISNGFPYYRFEHKVPANKQSRNLKKILRETGSEITLALPVMLTDWLSNDLMTIPHEHLKEVLQKINQKHRTRLTVKRIVGFLNHYLSNQGVDDILIALLRNESYVSVPALSYYSTDLHTPQSCHEEYLKYIFALAGKDIEIAPQLYADKHIGSPLFVNDGVCHNLFQFLAQNVDGAKDWIDFHNNYLLFTWAMLVFCTGHRDVNAPFGSILDYNPYFGSWWISDKECRSSLCARTLYLPKTAQKQINYYLEHLKAIIESTKLIEPQIMQHCVDAIEGKQNLFFAIIRKKQGFVSEDITPSLLSKLYPYELPLPNNWSRHYFRSLLPEQNVSNELINAWMGHQSHGAEAFGKHSGLAITDLKIISRLIEDVIKRLNIGATKGWES